MTNTRGLVGISFPTPDVKTTIQSIRDAEEIGVKAAWLTSGGASGDSLTLLAVAAAQTQRILLGTSIMQSWSRHPVTTARQAQTIAGLAPGRFRLGVGPGHKQGMEDTFGADFRAPLGHLGEYLTVLKDALQKGTVDFKGSYYRARATLPAGVGVPVMASALRPRSFEMLGGMADGVISWVCPHPYVRDVALPALRSGAEKAGVAPPPLIVHAAACVTKDLEAARNAVREQLGYFPSTRFYAQMFEAAGFPRTEDSGWTDDMLDTVLISGDEAAVAGRVKEMFGWGAAEILASVVTVGTDRDASARRTMKLLADL